MAGNSGKKIADKNKQVLAFYLRIHYLSLCLFIGNICYHVLAQGHQLKFTANIIGNTLIWIMNHMITMTFQSTASQGSDLSATGGLISFLVDVFLVSWFVITTTTLISNYFVYVLVFIPVFGVMKLQQIWNSLFGTAAVANKKKLK